MVEERTGLRIVITGGTGMVGSEVLRACLADDRVATVLSVGRKPCGVEHPKLQEVVVSAFDQLAGSDTRLSDWDACFLCAGVSSFGLDEAGFDRLTKATTLPLAEVLVRRNPGVVLTYVSGAGTYDDGKGRQMWARVKGRVELELMALAPGRAFMFRLGMLVPSEGARSKTRLYQAFYGPFGGVMRMAARAFPGLLTTGPILGRAMIACCLGRAQSPRIEPAMIRSLGS